MSGKVVVAFKVTNMEIMEQTLIRLNHEFESTDDGFIIKRPYYDIEIASEKISCDSMNTNEVDKIKYEYQKDFQIYERTIRGEQFEVTETKDEIIILVS